MADNEETEVGLSLEESTKPGETTDLVAPEAGTTILETAISSDNHTISGSEAPSSSLTKDKTKVDILLKATANAPIMKKKKWAVSQDQHIGWISEFIKRYLKLDANERLFLYINQTFAPPPDQTVRNLYDCYGTDGKLIIHYCKSQAWG